MANLVKISTHNARVLKAHMDIIEIHAYVMPGVKRIKKEKAT